MEIIESIIHGIAKDRDTVGPDSAQVTPRQNTLPLDTRLQRLGEDVLKLYGTLSNSYGVLGNDPVVNTFPRILKSYKDDNTNFVDFSNQTTRLISSEISKSRLTTTSYPVFLRYCNQGRDWLLIAMLKLKEGVGIDNDTLDLNDSLFFDIGNLREAARVDIQKWINNEQPYLSFIKRGAGADSEASSFFRNALSCVEYVDAKRNTDLMIQALESYCENNAFEAEKVQRIRARVYEHCREMKDLEQPVNLIALSAFIDPESPASFAGYIRDNEIEITEVFSPHPSSFKKLQRLSKKFGTISVGFDVEDIYQERVAYDEESDSLWIARPPKDLIDKIRKAKGLPAGGHDDEDQ